MEKRLEKRIFIIPTLPEKNLGKQNGRGKGKFSPAVGPTKEKV